uniref:Uncharacterized protein n=1 Tax=Electrophorus electricus TaxID=8005 RepID=A0A4W4GLT1_ELEEL
MYLHEDGGIWGLFIHSTTVSIHLATPYGLCVSPTYFRSSALCFLIKGTCINVANRHMQQVNLLVCLSCPSGWFVLWICSY